MLAPNMIFRCRHGQGKATTRATSRATATTTATWFVHNPAIISALGSLWLVAVDLSQKLRQDVLMPTQLSVQNAVQLAERSHAMWIEQGRGCGCGCGWVLGSNILFNLKHYRKFSGNYALVQMPHIHICIVRSVTTHVPWAHYMPVHSPHFLPILPT